MPASLDGVTVHAGKVALLIDFEDSFVNTLAHTDLTSSSRTAQWETEISGHRSVARNDACTEGFFFVR